ncbi:MAG: aldo/keto reductase [Candidatus Melainabacteria bacterium]|jgi:aryl-alcohol dehydrogenase-like predicted oxidoreductase|nr:aldo/keto reductase [Candidatus Melainabacteria bacterium]
MKYRDFGKTGIKVSEIGFGTWPIGGNSHGMSYGPTDDKVSTDALNRALDLGINFFDTADVYGWGHAESLLGKCFRGKRDRIILAAKVGADFYQGQGFQTFTPEYISFALDKTLGRLRTDYLDVYQLHNPPLKLLNNPAIYEKLKELKREGKIRSWGVSVFSDVEGIAAINVGQPDCIQIAYNIFSFRPSEKLFPLANEKGCAIIARECLANGFLTGKYKNSNLVRFAAGDMRRSWPPEYIRARIEATERLQFLVREKQTMGQAALRFALGESAVSTALAGMKLPEQVDENVEACLESLSEEELKHLTELQLTGFKKELPI